MWKVNQTIRYHVSGQCLSASWWIMTLKAAGGGKKDDCSLFRLKQITPAELPCAGLCCPKEYLSISNGVKRPLYNFVFCLITGICVWSGAVLSRLSWVPLILHAYLMRICVFVVQRPLKMSDMKSMDLYVTVKPRRFCPTTGNPATLRSQRRKLCQDLSETLSPRLTRFPQRTLRTPLNVSLLLLHLPWSRAMLPSLLNSMNARQVKWRSRTT